jgi:hypothetical protein
MRSTRIPMRIAGILLGTLIVDHIEAPSEN